MADLFLETAARIGRRLVRTAEWSGGACTWTLLTADPADPEGPRRVRTPAAGSVYNGTAGIALFLTELHRLTGDADAARAAIGALRHALADDTMLPAQFGFYSGRVGVAFAAAHAARLLGVDELRAEAERYLSPLAGNEGDDQGADLVAGAAGAIPGLLAMAGEVDERFTIQMPEALAEGLMERAAHEPRGWSWGDARQVTNARNLCGLAHGAAGMGHGLMELYAARGDARHRYAAEQAYAYERQFFDPAEQNWLDLRHRAVSDFVLRRRFAELRAFVAEHGDAALPYEPRFMLAWCHGAPGIALSRLRALELLGTGVYLREAEAALEATRRSLEVDGHNWSLCHGVVGNALVMAEGARVLARPELRAFAEGILEEACARFEMAERPWPSGAPGRVPDPGLLLGDAGIGHALLRMHDAETPSPLLVTAPSSAAPHRPETVDGARALARRDADEYFARALRLLGAPADAIIPAPSSTGALQGMPAAVDAALAAHVSNEEDDARRERLKDAFRLERERFAMTLAIDDTTRDFLVTQLPPRTAPPSWDGHRAALSPMARVVRTRWDWSGVLERGGTVNDAGEPPAGGAHHLLARRGGYVHAGPLTALAALVLGALADAPGTLDDVVDRVAEQAPDTDRAQLVIAIRRQMESAYATRLVDLSPVPTATLIEA